MAESSSHHPVPHSAKSLHRHFWDLQRQYQLWRTRGVSSWSCANTSEPYYEWPSSQHWVGGNQPFFQLCPWCTLETPAITQPFQANANQINIWQAASLKAAQIQAPNAAPFFQCCFKPSSHTHWHSSTQLFGSPGSTPCPLFPNLRPISRSQHGHQECWMSWWSQKLTN